MTEGIVFFDTYAFFEILEGAEGYSKYAEYKGITTIFNFAEIANVLERENKPFAKEFLQKNESMLIPATIDDLIAAAKFRKTHKKLSMPDAIGYMVAKRVNVKFLTGDQEFEKLPNVEYIK